MKSRDGILTALNILVYHITRFIYFRLSRYKIVVFSDREKQKITVGPISLHYYFFIVCILMYINNKYQWLKGQGYNSRTKVKDLGQPCIIQYCLNNTSSTFVYVYRRSCRSINCLLI